MSTERQVVLITGCSSGIGRALALAFHEHGCLVYASARKPETLSELCARGIRTLKLDVTRGEDIAAAVALIQTQHQAIDILINNAGIPVMGPVAELPLDELRQQWETNLTAPMALIQAALPAMIAHRRGRIVNIGSVSGILTTPFAGPYCASKAALHAMNEALRMELKPFGIEVLLVQPGAIESGFGASAHAQTGGHAWRLYAAYAQGIAKRAGASQEHATPATVFAQQLLRAVLAPHPQATIRIGAGSRLLPLLACLPQALRDAILLRRFGLR